MAVPGSVPRPISRGVSRMVIASLFASGAGSGASELLDGETQGLALDFTDDWHYASTGFYGSARVIDTGTPANNYNSSPTQTASSLLTYTSPSVKMTMGPAGVLRFNAHNLFLNSASPANQSVTVVSGATYSVILTGSVTTTISGAATGTITAGTTSFTAATATLTFGSTSGTGTVQVTRTPADLAYLATAGTIRYALPLQFTSVGVLEGLLVEEARTCLALHASDLTNAAWTKSNLTTAKTATGPDGVANSATTCTATAGNATALQAITSGSAARVTHVWLKRRTGTGNIDVTQDNGTTWATQVITSSWAKYAIASVTSANPTIGIRVVTSGDAVDVALFNHDLGAFATSSIETVASTVTRAADNISLAASAIPTAAAQTFFAEVKFISGVAFANNRIIGYNNSRTPLFAASATSLRAFDSVDIGVVTASDMTTALRKVALAGDATDSSATEGGAVVTVLADVEMATLPELRIGNDSGLASFLNGVISKLVYLPRRMTNAELQTLTGA